MRVRRHQRLTEHLAAEHATMTGIAALAAKQIEFETLELEDLQHVGEEWIHGVKA